MDPTQNLLRKDLDAAPEDWDRRLSLAARLVETDGPPAAEALLLEAPVPPPDEACLARLLGEFETLSDAGLLRLVDQFVAVHPASSMAHYVLAQLHALEGRTSEAAEHYLTACAFDPSLEDPELAALEDRDAAAATATASSTSASSSSDDVEPGQATVQPKALVAPDGGSRDRGAPPSVSPIQAPAPEESLPDCVPEEEPAPAPPAQPVGLAVTAESPIGPDLEALAVEDGELLDHPNDAQIALIVGEGGAIQGMGRESDSREKLSALTVAIVVHAAIFLLLALVIVSMPRPKPPNLVATAIPSVDQNDLAQQVVQKRMQNPTPQTAASTPVSVTTVVAASPVALPDIETTNFEFDDVGMGDELGMSMVLSDATGAGMVSFFGSRSKAQKVVFVVDSSISMKSKGKTGKSKHDLMKEELIRSVKALPPTVEFQIIFFSGPAWFVGDDEDRGNWHKLGNNNYAWHYKDGEIDQLPKSRYIKATASKVRQVIDDIEETPMTGGTDWRSPLKMAMLMKPDVIYFMTDGAVQKHPKLPPVVDDVLDFNRTKSRAKINSICLMVPKATEMLAELAEKSRGEFTLVTEDGDVVRGKDIERVRN